MNNIVNDDSNNIAVVGIGCRYPGAESPKKLWENILSRRREFRRFPDQRLPVSEYYDKDPKAEDKLYINKAAYIDGFEFDWIKRRIPKASVEATDIVQWLTLEVADLAIQDAGYTKETMPGAKTGVVVGNSLTGEQSRASTMRIRWPFVKKALLRSAKSRGLSKKEAEELAETMETVYKSVFPPVTEDSLQGGLSNTIAGRVSNYFDLHGGGYNVDGACASSLLAICTAADHLRSGNWDIAIAGGVDVSLDTFELIGFAKTSALTPDDMTVYDERGNGFLPGEGCGFVVLKRLKDAIAAGDEIYSVIKGWGVSSDGKGGMTAPSSKGQSQALQRAYNMAGYSPGELDFIEGHGTGTRVGDKIELEGIGLTMESFGEMKPRNCGMTSFKSIVGHTKAAAGVGAFIKTVMAVNRRVMPPTANCKRPNPVFADKAKYQYPILQGEKLDPSKTLRAGVSAMGFGGINSHITLESPSFSPSIKFKPDVDENALLNSTQETELFVFSAENVNSLSKNLVKYSDISAEISIGELADLANLLSENIDNKLPIRAVCMASNPEQLSERLQLIVQKLSSELISQGDKFADELNGIWVSNQCTSNKVGFLFPGQGSQQINMARVLVERFDWAKKLVGIADEISQAEIGEKISDYLYGSVNLAVTDEEKREAAKRLSDTQIAQPAICLASIIYGRYLQKLGLEPTLVAGHSLGELTSFSMAGLMTDRELIQHAILRGRVMKSAGNGKGSMASIFAGKEQVLDILEQIKGYAVIANLNSPEQTIISGDIEAVEQAVKLAAQKGLDARQLNVSGAFHSKHMDPAAESFAANATLAKNVKVDQCSLFTSTDGKQITELQDVADHFAKQMLQQVNFVDLIRNVSSRCDLLIEVGPGRVLANLSKRIVEDTNTSILCVSSTANNDQNLNECLATYFIAGGSVNWSKLYESRLVRQFVPASERNFIDNPCERTMSLMEGYDEEEHLEAVVNNHEVLESQINAVNNTASNTATKEDVDQNTSKKAEDVLISLVADRTGYPSESIMPGSRLLDDLNLDSIKAGELIATFAKQYDAAGKVAANDFVNSSLTDIVSAVLGSASTEAVSTKAVSAEKGTAIEKPISAAVKESTSVVGSLQPALLVLKEMVEQRTGYPQETIEDTSRLLDDLNLDSIKAGELIATFAKQYDAAGKVAANDFVNSSLTDIVSAVLGSVPTEAVSAKAVSAEKSTSIDKSLSVAVKETTSVAGLLQPALLVLKEMVEQRTGYPLETIEDSSRLLDDLNLDSIKAGELIATFAKQYDAAGQVAANDLVNSSLTDIVSAVLGSTSTKVVAAKTVSTEKGTAIGKPVSAAVKETTSVAVSSQQALYVLKEMVEQRTGYPLETIEDSSRLLDDLNLDSIKAGELIATFAKQYDAAGQVAANDLVNSSLTDIVSAVLGSAETETVSAKAVSAEKGTAIDKPVSVAVKETTSVAVSSQQALYVLKEMVEQRTGYPLETIEDSSRLLDDLNLDSIKAGELIATFAKQYDAAGQVAANDLVNSSLTDIVSSVLENSSVAVASAQVTQSTSENKTSATEMLDDADLSDDNFIISYVEEAGDGTSLNIEKDTTMLVVHEQAHQHLVDDVVRSFKQKGMNAVNSHYQNVEEIHLENVNYVIALIPRSEAKNEDYQSNLVRSVERLQSVVSIANKYQPENVAILQFGGGRFGSDLLSGTPENIASSSFLRSWSLERPAVKLRVLDLAENISSQQVSDNLAYDFSRTENYLAVGYDRENIRRVPKAIRSESSDYVARKQSWSKDDVVVVTGGAKGITAECVVKLAETVKAKFVLLGSSPLPTDSNSEIVSNLKRLEKMGIICSYIPCDLTDKNAVEAVLTQVKQQFGAITALVHGAGINLPRLVNQVSAEQAFQEISPKLLGMRHMLNALANQPPKLVVGLTSIIGIAGMTGNAWYAFANESVDLLLRQFAEQHKETTEAVSLGYTVWKEVGMGHRLGVIDNLENSGVGALSVKEGTYRFSQLFHNQAADQQVAIIGELSGLATWQQLLKGPAAVKVNYRYVDNIIRQEAEALTVRTRLNEERDPYLKDHNFNGTYLLPTVFGLEAMAQVATSLMNDTDVKIVEISNIGLELPITVGQGGDTEIEIQAQIQATTSDETTVTVGILTENTGFASEHFSATYLFSKVKAQPKIQVTAKTDGLLIQPKIDLYNGGGVLFQGDMFQRMEKVYSLTPSTITLTINRIESKQIAKSAFADEQQTLLLSDPFYRDVLLQSVQLPLAPEFVLPVAIGKISFYTPHSFSEKIRFVQTTVKEHIGRDYLCDVIVSDEHGNVIEQLSDYKVRALQKHSLNVTPEQISSLATLDQLNISQLLESAFERLNVHKKPSISIGYTPGLQQHSKEQRHQMEIPFIEQAVSQSIENPVTDKLKIYWNDEGKPCLGNEQLTEHDISMSHDEDYCIALFGKGEQGCDIEIVKQRSREDWQGLLGNARMSLLDELVEQGDQVAIAGVRIWSAIEAVRKMNVANVKEVLLAQYKANEVVLEVISDNKMHHILSVPITLVVGDERVISTNITHNESIAKFSHDIGKTTLEPESTSSLSYDASTDQMVFEYDLQVGFKECGNLSRTVYYTSYLQWVGKVRELFMSDIASELVPQVASGDWGLVTNWAELNIFNEAKCYDKIKARFRLGKVYDSVIPLHCEFFKVEDNGNLLPLAHVTQETTWVEIIGHGQVIPALFPPYFKNFLDKTDAKSALVAGKDALMLDKGRILYQAKAVPGGNKAFFTGDFNTCFEDANLVGNIYYANYFIWQGRVRNNFLGEVIPDFLKGVGEQGELLCIRSRMDYLRDAMPFDQIHVSMSLKSLHEHGAVLGYQFYRTLEDGKYEKLSVGEQEVVWVNRTPEGVPVPAQLPAVLKDRLQVNEQVITREVA